MARHVLRKSTIFIILLTLQANVAAADPVPSLGAPRHAQARHDAANGTIQVTWEPPTDTEVTYTYEVRRDNVLVYAGADLAFTDTDPAMVVAYTITAHHDGTHGAAAIAIASPIDLRGGWPHCTNLVTFEPELTIHWECIFPLPN